MSRSSSSSHTAGISARKVADYLVEYIRRYRSEYERFTSPPPDGCGYPRLDISPYLSASSIYVYLTLDGCAIADFSNEPEHDWHIAGGPALMVDTQPTQVPSSIVETLRKKGLHGKDIGIFRLLANSQVETDVRTGKLPDPSGQVKRHVDNTKIIVQFYANTFYDLLARLTMGVIGPALDLHIADVNVFWTPRVIRAIGVTVPDRTRRRWFNYLELDKHTEEAAWDRRSIWARVSVDVRRHFLHAIATLDQPRGTITLERAEAPPDLIIRNKLDLFKQAIDGFSKLLEHHGDATEATFHNYLRAHPLLLDLYGSADSKPRFNYPPPHRSPTGKKYLEPDFVITYPGRRYKLVELERPNKGLATQHGEPRSEVGQATFQIAEWQHFIKNHYNVLSERYPDIFASPLTQVIISRSTLHHARVTDVDHYLGLLREQYSVDDIITYDILLKRAREAYARLSGAMA